MDEYIKQLNDIIYSDNLNIPYNIITLNGYVWDYTNGDYKKIKNKILSIIDSILAVKSKTNNLEDILQTLQSKLKVFGTINDIRDKELRQVVLNHYMANIPKAFNELLAQDTKWLEIGRTTALLSGYKLVDIPEYRYMHNVAWLQVYINGINLPHILYLCLLSEEVDKRIEPIKCYLMYKGE